jgi:SH3-like domain-containing protein
MTTTSRPSGADKAGVSTRAALVAAAVALALFGVAAPAAAQTDPPAAPAIDGTTGTTEGASGRPLPRFVSLRSSEANMRAGPGLRYPVLWVYERRGLPLEVMRETDRWREVRDPDGATGWMHVSMLTNSERRAVVRADAPQVLWRRPEADAEGVARVQPGVIVKLLQCPREGSQCRVEAGRFQGWLDRSVLWGVLPGEYVD